MITIHDHKFTFECNECGEKLEMIKKGESFNHILNSFFSLGWAFARKEKKDGPGLYYFCPVCKDKGKKKIREIKINEICKKLKRTREGVV